MAAMRHQPAILTRERTEKFSREPVWSVFERSGDRFA